MNGSDLFILVEVYCFFDMIAIDFRSIVDATKSRLYND